jgi:hypothetical protein
VKAKPIITIQRTDGPHRLAQFALLAVGPSPGGLFLSFGHVIPDHPEPGAMMLNPYLPSFYTHMEPAKMDWAQLLRRPPE